MDRRVLLSVKDDIMAKADKVADDLVRDMACSGVFVSLANTDLLFSIGMSAAHDADDAARLHDVEDSVCGITVSKNEALFLPDARAENETSEIPYVAAGHIVGYLGQPIRDRDANAIGAICAFSTVPRDWSKADEMMLKAARLEVENLIANAVYDMEGEALSLSLAEYDSILGSIALNADLRVSIHGVGGELLFATNALLERVDAAVVEDRIQNRGTLQRQGPAEQKPVAPGKTVTSEAFLIQNCTDASKPWVAHVQECANGTLFVCWDAKTSL